jgi:Tfp pilus assembly protein PilO
MDESNQAKPSKLQASLANLAYSPVKLRIVLSLLLLGAWYGGFAMQHTDEIDTTTRELQKERNRLDLSKQVERLRKQVARFQERIPASLDANEWVQYMLSGSRLFELRVTSLETNGRKEAGPYKVVVMKMDVEGSFRDVDGFLRWVESNRRLLRVDSLTLVPQKQSQDTPEKMRATMVILGIT